jgi:uncharacterized protein VcgC/VcgE DUF2780
VPDADRAHLWELGHAAHGAHGHFASASLSTGEDTRIDDAAARDIPREQFQIAGPPGVTCMKSRRRRDGVSRHEARDLHFCRHRECRITLQKTQEDAMRMMRFFLSLAMAAAVVAAGAAQTPDPQSAADTANPELVGALAKEIGATPKQAEGAAGALFGLAKSKLGADDWTKVAGAIPGMDGLLKAAPAMAAGGTAAAIPGLGGLSSVAGAFSKLNLKPELVMKAVPILTKYASKVGGADIGKLLAGVLK